MSTLTAPNPAPTPWRGDATTIGLVSTAHGLSHFCQLMVAPLFPWIGESFGLSFTQLGLLMTVFFVVSGIGQALAGFVVDHHGARKVLFGGLALLATAAALLALAPGYPVLMLAMVLAGLGNCVFHPVDFSILNARVSTGRLGQAYAVHGISGSVGWALAPLFVVGITQATGSWRMALAAVALLIVAVLALLVLQRDALAVPSREHTAAAAARADGGSLGFLKLAAVWSCFVFFLFSAVALGAVQTFAPAAAGRLHGVPITEVAVFITAYMLASAAGMVLGGQLARQPQRGAQIVGLGMGGSAVVALLIGLGTWPGWSVPFLFAAMGFGAGIAGPSRDLLVKQATPPGATGRVYGVVYSGLDVGQAFAPALFGALMDGGQYRAVWVVIAITQGLLIASAFNVQWRSRK